LFSGRGKGLSYISRSQRNVVVSLEQALLYVNVKVHDGVWVPRIVRRYRAAVETIARHPTETPSLYHLRRIALHGKIRWEDGYAASDVRLPRYEWGAAILALAQAVANRKISNLRLVERGAFAQPPVDWQAVVHSLRDHGWTQDAVRRDCGLYKWQGFPWRRWAQGISPCYVLGTHLLDMESKTRLGVIHPRLDLQEAQKRKGRRRDKIKARVEEERKVSEGMGL